MVIDSDCHWYWFVGSEDRLQFVPRVLNIKTVYRGIVFVLLEPRAVTLLHPSYVYFVRNYFPQDLEWSFLKVIPHRCLFCCYYYRHFPLFQLVSLKKILRKKS